MSDYKRILSEMRDPSLEGYRHSALLDLIGRAADKFASVLYEIERLQKDAARVRNDALDAAIKILQGYRVSVGNSSAGELAAEWTLNALRECVDEIRALKEKRDE